MSFGPFRKLLSCLGVSAFLWLAMPAVALAQSGFQCATFGAPCAVGCHRTHCPPAFKHCYEGGPHIHWTRGCPHPICNPCDLPHWGFYETCWTPWPWPTNFAHCPTPPPAQFVNMHGVPDHRLPPVRTMPAPMPTPGVAPPPAFPMPNGVEEIPLPPPNRRFEQNR